MFDVSFLNRLRNAELDLILPHLPAGARLLEFGAGTGIQARRLADLGFDVTAVDLATSEYSGHRQFPILDYDGQRIPLPDASVDVVYSSNVLEHVPKIQETLVEFRRVTKPGGHGVHLMPSVAWRFWTSTAGPFTSAQAALHLLRLLRPSPNPRTSRGAEARRALKFLLAGLLPLAPGTSRDAFSELWTFRAAAWRRTFARAGFEVDSIRPTGLFHSGHMLMGPALGITSRTRLARHLGSAANLYKVHTKPLDDRPVLPGRKDSK